MDIRNGYINVNNMPVPIDHMAENTKLVAGDYKNLDPIFQDDSLEEIIFNPPLSVVTPNQLPDLLTHWHKKLKHGGILKIHTIDIRKVGRAAHSGNIGLQDIHNLILGENYEYKSVIDTSILRGLILRLGYKIETITPIDFISIFEVIKHA